MSYENLLVAREAATVTVNRPNVLNALNAQTVDELRRLRSN
jgi:enoyl-CoA hydratase/carnithine racemase